MATLFKSLSRVCPECRQEFRAARSDSVRCSSKCRMRFLRRCDAITRGASIAADAKGGAFVAPVKPGTEPTVTSPRPVVTATPAAVTTGRSPPAEKKPSRVKGPWGNGLPKNTRGSIKRASKPAKPKPKAKKGRGK